MEGWVYRVELSVFVYDQYSYIMEGRVSVQFLTVLSAVFLNRVCCNYLTLILMAEGIYDSQNFKQKQLKMV
jgi:hypothetical protein